ncbi:MAG: tRNA 4-thiouridine(8) synthase ThiI [Lachnospiraceae bacterium]|nr:tRNA 4-thiouridine(8) synthase ThiI [Lachnospiraceae bacterium]
MADYQAFIIKYAEIGVKGKNRHLFEEALVRGVQRALDAVGEFRVTCIAGRLYAEAARDFSFDDAVAALQRVFGVLGICPAVTIPRTDRKLPDIEALGEACIRYFEMAYGFRRDARGGEPKRSFKVVCRRVDKSYPMDSMEVAAAIGEKLLDALPELRVDVHEPDILFHVELREQVNLFSEEIPGPGGLPTGTAGRAMLLLSGGIDSPVAGYQIAKRGAELEAVYFHAPPYTSDRAKQKVIDLGCLVARFAGPIRLHVVNFTAIQLAIYEKCPRDELTIIMRRCMMHIAEELAVKNDCIGLITGESIGQVASQTMQSLAVTDAAVRSLPVYRPLIAHDKQEIITISERIGTYETSILPYEDCCTIFVAKHPVTHPRLDVIMRHERLIEEELAQLTRQAIDEEEIVTCRGNEAPEQG